MNALSRDNLISLLSDFFPESRRFVTLVSGLGLGFIKSMQEGIFLADYSCDLFAYDGAPDLGFGHSGGLRGDNDWEDLKFILWFTEMLPVGRVIVYPDNFRDETTFLCLVSELPERLSCRQNIQSYSSDCLFVFESGEAILVDHDGHLFWARSRINRQWERNPPAPVRHRMLRCEGDVRDLAGVSKWVTVFVNTRDEQTAEVRATNAVLAMGYQASEWQEISEATLDHLKRWPDDRSLFDQALEVGIAVSIRDTPHTDDDTRGPPGPQKSDAG